MDPPTHELSITPPSTPLRWGVVGLGRAGRAKIKALNQLGLAYATLIATSSRRGALCEIAYELDPSQTTLSLPWTELMTHPEIDVVAICTENALHKCQVEYALRAGKHVLVDFPLCATLAEAKMLYQLAHQKKRLLHLELIGRLTDTYKAWSAHVHRDPLVRWESVFQGGFYRWICDEVHAGRYVLLSIARVHQAWGLAGPFKLKSANFKLIKDQDQVRGYQLYIEAVGRRDAQIMITEHRALDLKRHTQVMGLTQNGLSLERLRIPQQSSLFLQDLHTFYRSLKGEEAYVSIQEIMDVYQFISEVEYRIS